jgi:uncharacterized protein (TIGR02598 family)
MNTTKLFQPRRFSRAGFSLVEVVLAVGIMALGVVTILGLLPHGLEISRQTANELAESRIIDSIVSDYQAMTWTEFNTAADATAANRFYDDQGLSIDNGDADAMATDLTYVVKVEIPEPNVVLPSDANLPPNQNLRRLTIKVVAVPEQNFNFDSPPPGVPIRTVTQLVARMR